MGGLWSQPENTTPEGLLSKPWRALPKNNQKKINFVKSYQPQNQEAKHLRILLIGPVGAGKSSFINAVDSVLQDRIAGRALVDAITGGSITQKYETYKIRKDSGGYYPFIFNDTMGFEEQADSGVNVEDIKLALKGHVKNGYKFKPKEPLREGEFYKSSPTLDDRVHVLVSVVPAGSVSVMSQEVVEKLREVRLAASDMRIPQLAIVTKIDQGCPEAKGNINNAYKSKYLKELVEKVSAQLGMPLNCIFLVKNYDSETKISDDVNALILVALKQMIWFGEDFLNDQLG